jgi:hypothetical protein
MFAPTRITLAAVLVVIGCGDNSPAPTGGTFRVQIENIAPWQVLESSTQVIRTNGMRGPAGPAEAFEFTFTGGKGHAVSFASMFGESNDWFFAPAGGGIPLYDAAGGPISGDVTAYVLLWDAGSEIDQEPAVGEATGPQQPSADFGARDPNQRVRRVTSPIVLADGQTFAVPAVSEMLRATLTAHGDTSFTLRVENVSTPATLVTSLGAMPISLSPLVWAVHAQPDPLFVADTYERRTGLERLAEQGMPDTIGGSLAEDRGFATPVSPGVATTGVPLYELGGRDFGEGLERLAEDGDPAQLAAARADVVVFDTPLHASEPRAAMPGEAFSFEITGERLHLAMMFGMSNDWIFATPADGVLLLEGSVTDQLVVIDLGTELDEEPAIGPNTAPQQLAPNTGLLDPTTSVRPADYDRRANEHIRVMISEILAVPS